MHEARYCCRTAIEVLKAGKAFGRFGGTVVAVVARRLLAVLTLSLG